MRPLTTRPPSSGVGRPRARPRSAPPATAALPASDHAAYLADVARVLETGAGEVHVDSALGLRARLPIDRMLAFTAALKNGQPTAGLVPHLGAA